MLFPPPTKNEQEAHCLKVEMAELWSTIKSCLRDIPLPCDCTLCCLEPTTDHKKCRIYAPDETFSLGPRYEQLLLCKSDGSEVDMNEDFKKVQKHVKWQLATMDYLWKMIGSTFQCINWRSETPWETSWDSYQGDLIRYILTLTEDSNDIADTSARLKTSPSNVGRGLLTRTSVKRTVGTGS